MKERKKEKREGKKESLNSVTITVRSTENRREKGRRGEEAFY